MKQINRMIWLFLVSLLPIACFEDDNKYEYVKLDEIVIEGIERSYVRKSHQDILSITPTVTTDADVEYAWELWTSVRTDGIIYKPDTIGREKNLNYEVMEDPGTYYLVFNVKDKKTGVTTLTVTMQDPLISAALTDTVMHCLQNYITDYRTNKARHDLAFTEKLFNEAQENYYEAQQKYARFMDGNQNIIMQSFRTEQERLQNEMNLAYGVFTQVSQQLQLAKAKVQEITPVYTVVQPATVPLRPAKPNKIMILIGFVFLAGVGSIGWILFVKDLLNGWKKQPEK